MLINARQHRPVIVLSPYRLRRLAVQEAQEGLSGGWVVLRRPRRHRDWILDEERLARDDHLKLARVRLGRRQQIILIADDNVAGLGQKGRDRLGSAGWLSDNIRLKVL